MDQDSVSQVLLCSYDPNDKKVSPNGLSSSEFIHDYNFLTYQVRFQNTGNYPAQDILIVDTLSPQLDLSSFEFLGASHTVHVNVKPGNVIHFYFENIFLPDSISDEPNSHGTLKYRVKPLTSIQSDTEIDNTAHIFFDQNPAIKTNTTTNIYFDCNDIDLSLDVNFDTITALQIGADYQWYNCDAQIPITGANANQFISQTAGNYSLIVKVGACVDTTVCVFSSELGLADEESELLIYPNPTKDYVVFENKANESVEINVVNTLGQKVAQFKVEQNQKSIQKINLKSGIYYFVYSNNNQSFTEKVIVW